MRDDFVLNEKYLQKVDDCELALIIDDDLEEGLDVILAEPVDVLADIDWIDNQLIVGSLFIKA